jgi:hypothetical protein
MTTPEAETSNRSTVSPAIQVGDTVAYTDTFIDRHSRYPNDLQSAQGVVKALHTLDSGMILADIDWNRPGHSKRINLKNLTKVEPVSLIP